MRQVKVTKDYSLFYYIKGNRPLGARVKKMIKAIKKRNLLKDFPILCTPPDRRTGMRGILDGQARFESAKRLGEPIYFLDSEEVKQISDVSLANATQSAWKPKDYVISFADQGNPHYIKLKEFIEVFGLPVTTSASLLAGMDAAGGGNALRYLTDGRFEITNEKQAREVATVIMQLKRIIPFATDRSLAQSIIRLMTVRGFDPDRMVKKIAMQAAKFIKCANWEQYIDLIEDMYNYKTRNPDEIIPLAIEVRKQIVRNRKAEV